MRRMLPASTLQRPKRGFAVPLAAWFRGPQAGYVREVLLSRASRQRGVINPAYVERLIQLNDRGRDMDRELWTLLSFEQWCRTFLDRAAARPVTRPVVVLKTTPPVPAFGA
jgi:asparagine synthase (glutamine-hydrolysing)